MNTSTQPPLTVSLVSTLLRIFKFYVCCVVVVCIFVVCLVANVLLSVLHLSLTACGIQICMYVVNHGIFLKMHLTILNVCWGGGVLYISACDLINMHGHCKVMYNWYN